MKHFISFIILFVILIYLGIVSYCCTLTFDNAEKIEEQQEQIDDLEKYCTIAPGKSCDNCSNKWKSYGQV